MNRVPIEAIWVAPERLRALVQALAGRAGMEEEQATLLAGLLVGLRVPSDDERQGLDITAHGETAYTR